MELPLKILNKDGHVWLVCSGNNCQASGAIQAWRLLRSSHKFNGEQWDKALAHIINDES